MFWVRISIRARYTTLCDKVRQWLATCRWFSPEPTVSSTNKADRHDKTEILLKVALNTTKQTNSEMSHIWKEYLTSKIIKQDKSSKYYTLCVEQNTVNFQQYFSFIVAVSCIGGGNRRFRRKPPTCRKSLTNFIT
jgi:hypothetical protein